MHNMFIEFNHLIFKILQNVLQFSKDIFVCLKYAEIVLASNLKDSNRQTQKSLVVKFKIRKIRISKY